MFVVTFWISCKAHVISCRAWESTAEYNSYPAGCYVHPAGCELYPAVLSHALRDITWALHDIPKVTTNIRLYMYYIRPDVSYVRSYFLISGRTYVGHTYYLPNDFWNHEADSDGTVPRPNVLCGLSCKEWRLFLCYFLSLLLSRCYIKLFIFIMCSFII